MRRAFSWSLAGVVGLAGLAGVWICVRPSPLARLDAVVEDLRARGEPVTYDDLAPPLPPGLENGADDIDAALLWLDANAPPDWQDSVVGPWDDDDSAPFYERASPEQLDELRRLLAVFEPFFEHVDRAVSRAVIQWPLPPQDAVTGERPVRAVPILQRVQPLLYARIRTTRYEPEHLAATLVQTLLAARFRPRSLIERLARWRLRRFSVEALRDGVETGVIDPVDARAEFDELLTVEPIAEFPTILREERAWMVETLPHILDGTHPMFVPAPLLDQLRDAADRLLQRDAPRTRRAVANMLLDEISAVSLAAEIPPSWDAAYRDQLELTLGDGPVSTVALKAEQIARRSKAEHDLARVALASCRFRAENGRWPEALEELAPLLGQALVRNPHTAQRYELSVEGDVLLLDARNPEEKLPPEEDSQRGALVWCLPASVVDDR